MYDYWYVCAHLKLLERGAGDGLRSGSGNGLRLGGGSSDHDSGKQSGKGQEGRLELHCDDGADGLLKNRKTPLALP